MKHQFLALEYFLAGGPTEETPGCTVRKNPKYALESMSLTGASPAVRQKKRHGSCCTVRLALHTTKCHLLSAGDEVAPCVLILVPRARAYLYLCVIFRICFAARYRQAQSRTPRITNRNSQLPAPPKKRQKTKAAESQTNRPRNFSFPPFPQTSCKHQHHIKLPPPRTPPTLQPPKPTFPTPTLPSPSLPPTLGAPSCELVEMPSVYLERHELERPEVSLRSRRLQRKKRNHEKETDPPNSPGGGEGVFCGVFSFFPSFFCLGRGMWLVHLRGNQADRNHE